MASSSNTKKQQAAINSAIQSISEIRLSDLNVGISRFDAWLNHHTDGVVTLAHLKAVAGSLPITGNILAAVDVCGDLVSLVEQERSRNKPTVMDWVGLGIDLIGIIPVPGGSAARMSLRPMLGVAREMMIREVKALPMAILAVMAGSAAAQIKGELLKILHEAEQKMTPMIQACADKAADILEDLEKMVDTLASGQMLSMQGEANDIKKQRSQMTWHHPMKSFKHILVALADVQIMALKQDVNAVGAIAVKFHGAPLLKEFSHFLRNFAQTIRTKLPTIAKDMLKLLGILVTAISAYEAGRHLAATVSAKVRNRS